MEVSNVRDHVTHAIISGGKTIDFGISDSPEFFHILSSTLYSDQPLAVVREVLCNAWDAHIEAGRTDRAVEVTLTHEELIIRDFGKGISDDDIGPIYGVYGASTKKSNQQVTGGFGLGCKAPFAYTDHFEVVSWHDGRKTIYNMSKSSAEVNGRPGIVPIASFPADETGLQVKIQLKSSHDRYRFQELIKRIAANGEMNVWLNGDAIDVLPFSTMEHGFMVTNLPVIEGHHQNILIRYGHVIYPVEIHDDFREEFRQIGAFLEKLPDSWGEYSIIFQAKPDSISVTPSRESLSMQEHTIKSLTEIFHNFAGVLRDRAEPETINVLETSIVNVWSTMQPKELFSTGKVIPGLKKSEYGRNSEPAEVMVELPKIVRAQAAWHYPNYRDFRFRDLLARVDSLLEANFGNKGLVNSFRSELLRRHRRKKLHTEESTWLHRKVLAPLVSDLKAAKLNPKKLAVYSKPAFNDEWRSRNSLYQFFEANRYQVRHHEDYLPYLRNIVVLAHNRTDVAERVDRFPIMKHWLGAGTNLLCFIVPRNPKKIAEAREFFKARKVNLIDLTVYHSWETPPEPIKPVEKVEVKPRPKGLPILGSLLNGGDIRMDFLDFDDDERDIRRTETPTAVAKLGRGERRYSFEEFGRESTEAICQLWPNEIAVTVNTPQYKKYLEKGAAPFKDWVVKNVCTEIRKNKRIHKAIALDFNRILNIHYEITTHDALELIYEHDFLMRKYRLSSKLTPLDKLYFTIWQEISQWWRGEIEKYPEIGKTKEIVDKIELSPAVTELHNQLKARRAIIDTLDIAAIRRILLSDDSPKTKPFQETTKRIVLLALKG